MGMRKSNNKLLTVVFALELQPRDNIDNLIYLFNELNFLFQDWILLSSYNQQDLHCISQTHICSTLH